MFSGLRGLLSRKYPVPAGATGAASTMGVVGTPAIPMPSLGTTAQITTTNTYRRNFS